MNREELNKEIRAHQEYAAQLAQLLAAVDDEPEEQREDLLKDIWFMSQAGGETSMYLKNKQSRWPRLLTAIFGKGTKSIGSDGLNVTFEEASPILIVRGYLSPNCHIVKESYVEEEPLMVPSPAGETTLVTRTRQRVVCDEVQA